MAEKPPVIDPSLNPRPRCVAFSRRPTRVPGLAVREGSFENADGQQFVVTIAAAAEHEDALERYGRELRVWLRADAAPDGDSDVVTNSELDRQLNEALLEREEDDAPDAVHTAFDVRLWEAPSIEFGHPAELLVYVDPRIERNDVVHWQGPDDVIVMVDRDPPYGNSRVLVRGLTGTPHDEAAGPGVVRRDADGKCRIKGLADVSKYSVHGKVGAGKWKPD